jgi:1-acyl-sn-glycerol-3-phosphate acyltransferase
MKEFLQRLFKGFYMTMMFAIFALGIVCELICVAPVLLIEKRLFHHNRYRLQSINRRLFPIWISLLKLGGLLRVQPSRGKPVEGACVVVANHPGLFDVIILIRDIPGLTVMAKRALKDKLFLGPIFELSGYLFSPDMSTVSTATETIRRATSKLNEGYKFLLFPEGTRSPKGDLLPFKHGAFKIAQRANVPVQPVLIRNDPPFLPHEDKWYFPPAGVSRVCCEYWDPLPPPLPGEEIAMAKALEVRYRRALTSGIPEGIRDCNARFTR